MACLLTTDNSPRPNHSPLTTLTTRKFVNLLAIQPLKSDDKGCLLPDAKRGAISGCGSHLIAHFRPRRDPKPWFVIAYARAKYNRGISRLGLSQRFAR